jgi:hypothetical protein
MACVITYNILLTLRPIYHCNWVKTKTVHTFIFNQPILKELHYYGH